MKLVQREESPFNAETPLPLLADVPTPTPQFYVRNHFDVPSVGVGRWRLRVEGRVKRPLELSLEEIRRLPVRTLLVTLECAGNGRARMSPRPPGTPWEHGAVATARFTGASLHHVLDQAGVPPDAVEVLFTGLDRGEVAPGRVTEFARSLPVESARDPDVLLAWDMNGEALTRDHGYPLRLVVPDWYGVASVKWLASAVALREPFAGYFQKERYVYVGESGAVEGEPVTRMRVRSVIATPEDGAELARGRTVITGSAWSGYGKIRHVEVAVLGPDAASLGMTPRPSEETVSRERRHDSAETAEGIHWEEAELDEQVSQHAAVPWRFGWSPAAAGSYVLLSRASDAACNRQPLEPSWNAHGYGNNAVQRVGVSVS